MPDTLPLPPITPAADPVSAALDIARTGPISHDGPGRTDNFNTSVPAESFVIPADIVSSIGDGNTAHGLKVLSTMFPPATKAGSSDPVPVVVAGGEYVVDPAYVLKVGAGDLKKGHNALNQWVKKLRSQAISTLKKLPGPVR